MDRADVEIALMEEKRRNVKLKEQLAEAKGGITAAYLRGRRNKASELQDELKEALAGMAKLGAQVLNLRYVVEGMESGMSYEEAKYYADKEKDSP